MQNCVSYLAITGSDNSLLLLIGPLGTNFSEILIQIHIHSCKKMYLKMLSAKWCLFRLGLNVLTQWGLSKCLAFYTFNTMRPQQIGCKLYFTKHFFKDNSCVLIQNQLKSVLNGWISNNPLLIWEMGWQQVGDKPLTHIKITYPYIHFHLSFIQVSSKASTWQ